MPATLAGRVVATEMDDFTVSTGELKLRVG
jgi:hypothetical protein